MLTFENENTFSTVIFSLISKILGWCSNFFNAIVTGFVKLSVGFSKILLSATLREEIICERNFCGIYFCDLHLRKLSILLN